jgi:hypothetical protein
MHLQIGMHFVVDTLKRGLLDDRIMGGNRMIC